MEDLTVITPVGPGHEEVSKRCINSVMLKATHIVINDHDGCMGRSLARNLGLQQVKTKWVMFIDADDEMVSEGVHVGGDMLGVFGSIYGRPEIRAHKDRPFYNVYPQSNSEILELDSAAGLFCISGVFDTESAKSIGFHPEADKVESLEFALAFCAAYPNQWAKTRQPFTFIHCETPSATGIRGYDDLDWLKEIQPLFDFWKTRKLEPMTQKERFASRYWE